MSKDEILDALEDEREKLLETIDDLPQPTMLEGGVMGDWSVKDILAHLTMWEAELVKLLWQARQSQKPTTLHLSNPDVDAINASWRERARERPLALVLEDFRVVRKQTSRRVEAFSEAELNDGQLFTWLEGAPLWEWVAGDSFQHEAEHAAQIAAWRKQRGI